MILYWRRFNFYFLLSCCFFYAAFSQAKGVKEARYPGYSNRSTFNSPAGRIKPDTFPAGAKNCQTAPLLCKNQLDGYTGVLSSTPNKQTDPGPTISCGNIQNNQWLSFLAGSDSLSLRIKVSNCFSNSGLQIAILATPDCKTFKKIACAFNFYPGSDTILFTSKVDTTDPAYSNFTNLTVGSRYYIMLDGFQGDVCDFKISLNYGDILPVIATPPTITGPATVCANSTNVLAFSVSADPAALSYIWKVPAGATIVGSANGPSVSVRWGSGGSGPVQVQAVGSCDTSLPASKNVTVIPVLSGAVNQTICQGENFTFNGLNYSTAGDYQTTLTSASGCDSVVTLHLKVIPPATGTLDTAVCAGSCVNLHNKNFCAGQPADTIIWRKAAWTGCDSVVTVRLNVIPPSMGTLHIVVCAGDCVNLHNKNFCAGQPADTIILRKAAWTGCDSVVTVHLDIIPPSMGTLHTVVCAGGCVNIYNKNFCAGQPADTIILRKAAWTGCDSVVTVYLDIIPPSMGTLDTVVCAGGCVNIHNKSFCAGQPADTIIWRKAAWTGCDSVVRVNLAVLDLTASASVSGALNCDVHQVTLDGSGSSAMPLSAPLKYEWTNPSGAVVGAGVTQAATSPGVYTLRATASSKNVTCGKTANVTVIQTGSVPPAPQLLGGNRLPCRQSEIYSVSAPASNVAHLWTVPTGAIISAGAGTAAITVNWGVGVNGDVCVNDSNSCGIGPPTCLSVRIREVSDSFPIAGSIISCPGDLHTYIVANDTSIRQYKWTVSGGALISGGGSAKITVKWGAAGAGKIQLSPLNDCGTGKSSSLNVLVKDSTLTAPALAGAAAVCAGKTEAYNIQAVANARSYRWFLPDGGGQIVGSDSATIVNVQWTGAGTARLGLIVSNDCNNQKKIFISILVKDAALGASSVTGALTVCPGAFEKYAVTGAVNVSVYKWTLPDGGGTIVGSDSAATVNIHWLAAGARQVCVDVQNDCQVHKKICGGVQVVSDQIDSLPIQGANSICLGGVGNYSVALGGNISAYKWLIPAGNGQFIGPDTTRSANVRWSSPGAGQVCLDAQNSCGVHKKSCLNLTVLDTAIGAMPVSGSMNVCTSKIESYSVPPAQNIKNYKWTIPSGGGSVVGGDSAAAIQIRWDSSGNRQICVEAFNACSASKKTCLTVLAQDSRLDSPAISGSRTVCPGSTASYSTLSNPDITSYHWILPPGARQITAANANVSIAWDSAGIFPLCLQITNNCGVVKQTCINIEVKNTAAALAIAGNPTPCNTRSAIYSVPANANTTYTWKAPAGATIVGPVNSNTAIVKWGASQGGALCVIPTGGCASGVESCIRIGVKTVPAAPARILGPAQSCVGASLKYNVDSARSVTVYVWNYPGNTTETSSPEIPVAWALPGVFSVGVQTKNECGVSPLTALSVEVFSFPKSNAGKSDSICGKAYTLKAAASVGTGTWSLKSGPLSGGVQFSDARQAVCSANVSLPGVYIFQWKETNGGCSDSATVRILFKEVPQVTLAQADCAGDGLTYTITAKVNSAFPPFRLSGNVNGIFNGNTFVSNKLKSAFSYSFSVTDAEGCASDSLKGSKICNCTTVAGSITTSGPRICFGDSVQISSNNDLKLSVGDATEYILHDGTATRVGSIIARNQTGRFSFLPGMSYDQTYFIVLAAGKSFGAQVDLKAPCVSVSNGVPVTFKSKTTARISGDTVLCKNEKGTLLFSFSKPGLFNLSYQNGSNLYFLKDARDGLKAPVILSGTYTLATVSDEDGCTVEKTGSANIQYRPTPPSYAGADQVNCTASASLAGVLPPQAQGRWYCDSSVLIVSPNNPVSTVQGLKNGKYPFIWRVQDSVCQDQYSLDTVNIFIPLTPIASDFAIIGEINQTIAGNVASFAPPGTFQVTRLNEPGVGHFSFFSSGAFTYIPEKDWSGIVTFKYRICSAQCGDACDTGKVKIKINPPPPVVPPIDTFAEIPTAITPNGDGKNDFWVVDHIDDYPDNELLIFNRWGDVVYRSKPYKNNWGGTNQNGEPLPTGTYYYLLKLRIEDGKLFKGDVTILR